jgi:surface polysaccharide O-acyltransferase-like enzyme
MIGLYAVTPIINIYLKSATKKNILYAMVLCFGLSILNNSLFHFAPGVAISVNGFTHFLLYICYYLAGHYLKDAKLNRKQLSLSLVSIIFLVTIGTIGTYFMMKFLPAHSAMFQEYFSPNNVALSLLVFISFSNINFSRTNFIKPATKIIDPCTLGIYLIDPLFLNYLLEYPVLGLYSPVPWLGLFKFIILIFTVSFSVVYVFRLLFEKVPIIKYIFG